MVLQYKNSNLPDIEILDNRFDPTRWYVAKIHPPLNTLRIVEVDTDAKTVKYRLPINPNNSLSTEDVPSLETAMKDLAEDYRISGKSILVTVPFTAISLKLLSRAGKYFTLRLGKKN